MLEALSPGAPPAEVHPLAVVEPGAILGSGCRIGPFAVVEAGARVGDRCVLEPHARACPGAILGEDVVLRHGAVAGAAPQHLSDRGEATICRIGAGTIVGEYATVHRGTRATGETRVGARCFLMAYSHVAHDARIGDEVVLANAVQLAGHVEVGDGAFIGGGTAVHQFARIGALAFAAGGIRIDRDVAPWSRAMGEPPRWAGLNVEGLRRAGWSLERRQAATAALRAMFRRGLLLEAAMETLSSMDTAEADALGNFVKASRRGLLRPRR